MTAEKTTTMRLRSVRFKDGGATLTVLRSKPDTTVQAVRDRFLASHKKLIDGEAWDGIAGFAIVAWQENGGVFVAYQNGPKSQVAVGDVPRYVRDCLAAEQSVRWAE